MVSSWKVIGVAMSKAKRYNPTGGKKFSILQKGNFLYLFLAPLFLSVILALIAQNISAFIANFIAFGLFFITAKLNGFALSKEYEYHTTTLTKAPKPYKGFTAILLGASTLFTAWITGGQSLLNSIFLGIISMAGYFLYYGFDPREDKLDNIGDISAQFVIETLGEAREKLGVVEENMLKIKDKSLYKKLRTATDKAHTILDNIEEDPKDLRVARKFIIVYIDGVKNVTQSYTEIDEADITIDTKERLSRLLNDVEAKFDKEILRLKNNNQFNLDVQIDVLQQQIQS